MPAPTIHVSSNAGGPGRRAGWPGLVVLIIAIIAVAAALHSPRSAINVSTTDESLSGDDQQIIARLCERAASPVRRMPNLLRIRNLDVTRRAALFSFKRRRYVITRRVVGDYYVVRLYIESSQARYANEDAWMTFNAVRTNGGWQAILRSQ